MLAGADTVGTIAESWLAQFEEGLAAPGRRGVERLFHADSHFRDVLALSWHIKTVSGSDAIVRQLSTHAGRACPTGFKIDLNRTAPRDVRRAGNDAIETIFCLGTAAGRCSRVPGLTPDSSGERPFEGRALVT